jgi:hypothetical protein
MGPARWPGGALSALPRVGGPRRYRTVIVPFMPWAAWNGWEQAKE